MWRALHLDRNMPVCWKKHKLLIESHPDGNDNYKNDAKTKFTVDNIENIICFYCIYELKLKRVYQRKSDKYWFITFLFFFFLLWIICIIRSGTWEIISFFFYFQLYQSDIVSHKKIFFWLLFFSIALSISMHV